MKGKIKVTGKLLELQLKLKKILQLRMKMVTHVVDLATMFVMPKLTNYTIFWGKMLLNQ